MAQTTANLVGSVLSSSRTGDLDIQVEDNPSQNPDHDLDHDLDLHELPSSRRDSRKSWTVKAKRMHRVVEQVDEEPIGIVIFKWCLIFIGSAMLGKFYCRILVQIVISRQVCQPKYQIILKL